MILRSASRIHERALTSLLRDPPWPASVVSAMTTKRQGRTRFSAPLVAILTAAVLLALFVTDLLTVGGIISSRASINRAQRVQALIGSVRAELFDAETGARDFLLTGRPEYRRAYEIAMGALPARLTDLRRLTVDDPVQLQNVRELESLVNQKLFELGTTLELYERVLISQMAPRATSQSPWDRAARQLRARPRRIARRPPQIAPPRGRIRMLCGR